jgi:LysM repeat protein
MSILNQALQFQNRDTLAATIRNPFQKGIAPTGLMPQDFPNGFVITEYVNGVPLESTQIQLVGNLMPMQPFQWTGEQRLVTDYYPGNPEAVVQVLGGKEGNLVIHGRLKDKHYQDKTYYGVSYQLAMLLDEMRKRGNLLRFGMHGISASWIRYGFLEKTDFKMNKLSYIDYELTFFIISDKQPKNNFFAVDEKAAPSSLNQNLINAATTFNTTYSSVPTSMPQSIAGVINDAVSAIATQVGYVTNFIDTIVTTEQDIQASANRALGLIKNARTYISQLRRTFGALPSAYSSLSSSGSPKKQFTDSQANIAFLNEIIAAVHSIGRQLAQMQSSFEKSFTTTPTTRYRIIDGDTLQRIAIKFYGAPDNWEKIYDHNKLQSTVLVIGTVLEIPKL